MEIWQADNALNLSSEITRAIGKSSIEKDSILRRGFEDLKNRINPRDLRASKNIRWEIGKNLIIIGGREIFSGISPDEKSIN